MDARSDLGPVLPSRSEVYALAVEMSALARLALEFSMKGPDQDLSRACRQIEKMRALLGSGGGAHG